MKAENCPEYWNEKFKQKNINPSNLAKDYGGAYNKICDWVFKNKHNRVLDIGCGIGVVSFILKKRGFSFQNRDFVCLDFSEIGLKIAKEYCNWIKTIQASFCSNEKIIELENHKFDLIICHNVLEFVEDYLGFAQKAVNMLNDKGKIIFGFQLRKTRSNNPLKRIIDPKMKEFQEFLKQSNLIVENDCVIEKWYLSLITKMDKEGAL